MSVLRIKYGDTQDGGDLYHVHVHKYCIARLGHQRLAFTTRIESTDGVVLIYIIPRRD